MRGTVDGLRNPHSMLHLLPALYAGDNLAGRLVGALDEILAPAVLALDNLSEYFDPRLTPEDFLGWLGSWVAAVDDPTLAIALRRQLVARAVELHGRRGTRQGIADLVELLTGSTPVVEDSGGVAASTEPATPPPGRAPAELIVRVGPDVDLDVIEPVVAAARPVHVPYRIEVTQ